jgi:hypothetical protein
MLAFDALSQVPISALPQAYATLTGIQATTGLGTAVGSLSIPVTGVSATGSVGNVSLVVQRISITGVSGTSQLGQIIYNNSVTVSGLYATGSIGTVYLWSQIDDNQTANWADIDDSNTAGWTVVSTTQTANWTGILP